MDKVYRFEFFGDGHDLLFVGYKCEIIRYFVFLKPDLIELSMNVITEDFIPSKPAKALIVGHDPTLQKSKGQALCTLYANYYFKEVPKSGSELSKYNLAQSTFEQIVDLTNGTIDSSEMYVTNLCNVKLSRKKGGSVVWIPEDKARDGVERIRRILEDYPSIEYVFPMSLQVNYWLQKLGFYDSKDSFLEDSEPVQSGIEQLRFRPKKGRTFLMICGKQYQVIGGTGQIVVPTLHSKNYPIKGRFAAYSDCYQKAREFFRASVSKK